MAKALFLPRHRCVCTTVYIRKGLKSSIGWCTWWCAEWNGKESCCGVAGKMTSRNPRGFKEPPKEREKEEKGEGPISISSLLVTGQRTNNGRGRGKKFLFSFIRAAEDIYKKADLKRERERESNSERTAFISHATLNQPREWIEKKKRRRGK